jgi:hypothetical protein
MFPTTGVYFFSDTVPYYPVTNTTDKLTIVIDKCAELVLTPNELLNYVNTNYPDANIPEFKTQVAVFGLFELCSNKSVGSRVNFFQLAASAPCEGQVNPDYLGTGWALDFICGKQILYKNDQVQFMALNTPLVDPVTGVSYTNIEIGYYFIIGSDGFCKQRTGFIKSNTSLAFNADQTVITLQSIYPLFLTN